jgi:gluconokinase
VDNLKARLKMRQPLAPGAARSGQDASAQRVERRKADMTLLLMGVAGSGKTMVGELVSRKLGWEFLDGDDYQPAENIAKIKNGAALTDGERFVWFDRLKQAIHGKKKSGESLVVACSALKEEYRKFIFSDLAPAKIVYLEIDTQTAISRLSSRKEHFFPASLWATQFAILEPPTTALVIDARQSVERIVDQVVRLCAGSEAN